MTRLTRRGALAASAALPIAGLLRPGSASAAAHEATVMENAKKHALPLGGFQVSTLLAGTRTVADPHDTFGLNVDAARFAEVSRENFIPTAQTQFFFTPTVVNTGSEVVLFDTGLAPAPTLEALAAAGYGPGDVTTVVITHMHGDHVGGLIGDDGTETFPGARYVTGQAEFDHWSGTENETFVAKVKPLADRFELLADGGSVTSGITAMLAPGHTPGHMTYMVESDGQQLLVFADTANHYVWSLAYPEWEVRFDMDKAQAAATRKEVLGMLAADRIPFIGYHMPFPATGYVEAVDDRFRYVPASYQFMLE